MHDVIKAWTTATNAPCDKNSYRLWISIDGLVDINSWKKLLKSCAMFLVQLIVVGLTV